MSQGNCTQTRMKHTPLHTLFYLSSCSTHSPTQIHPPLGPIKSTHSHEWDSGANNTTLEFTLQCNSSVWDNSRPRALKIKGPSPGKYPNCSGWHFRGGSDRCFFFYLPVTLSLFSISPVAPLENTLLSAALHGTITPHVSSISNTDQKHSLCLLASAAVHKESTEIYSTVQRQAGYTQSDNKIYFFFYVKKHILVKMITRSRKKVPKICNGSINVLSPFLEAKLPKLLLTSCSL